MNKVKRLLLRKSLSVLCILISAVITYVVHASDIRLFHDLPETGIDNPAKNTNDNNNALAVPSKTDNNASRIPKRKQPMRERYRYDGFIASNSGKEYLVNGQPLHAQKTLTLLSVQAQGSILEIETSSGNVLHLEMGQFVSDE